MSGLDSPLSEALDNDIKEFLLLFNKLKQKYSEHALLKMLQAEKYFIPCNIFNPKLGPLETIVKYLVENEKLSLKKVSLLLGRTNKNIWQAYNASKKKHPEWFIASKEISFAVNLLLPLDIFNKNTELGKNCEKLSVLESLACYMKDSLRLTYHKIAVTLKRDDRTIWATYKRAVAKLAQ